MQSANLSCPDGNTDHSSHAVTRLMDVPLELYSKQDGEKEEKKEKN